MTQRTHSMTTALYRFFDAEGALFYVGITHRLNQRIAEHRKEKPWVEVAQVSIEHFDTRDGALAAESRAIRDENPKWNVVQNGGRGSVPPRSSTVSYHAKARQLWPDAEWISGSGKYATVAHCRVTTVELHADFEKAERALDAINRRACGGMCHRDHWFYNLETGLVYTEGRVGYVQ